MLSSGSTNSGFLSGEVNKEELEINLISSSRSPDRFPVNLSLSILNSSAQDLTPSWSGETAPPLLSIMPWN